MFQNSLDSKVTLELAGIKLQNGRQENRV